MRYDNVVIKEAERLAFRTIGTPFIEVESLSNPGTVERQPNPWFVNPKMITGPAVLVQEQAYAATTGSYTFDFSINGPVGTSSLNNIKMPQNNIFAIYALQLLIGRGDSAVSREYFTTGFSVTDRSIYNSNLTMKIESDTLVDNFDCQFFNEIPETPGMIDMTGSMIPINPIRVFSGKLGVFNITISPRNSLSGLTLTASTFLSMRVHGVMGQASA